MKAEASIQGTEESSQQLTKRSNAKTDSFNGASATVQSRSPASTATTSTASTDATDASAPSWWKRSLGAAFRGGASGSIAMVLQVVLLMWLRTTVNYQYKHGVDTRTALERLYGEGGMLRFYSGASFALLTGPIARFGDTAANEGIRELMGAKQNANAKFPVWVVTFLASATAALWRIVITPLDTIKTTLQVKGAASGWEAIASKIRSRHEIVRLWDGALGNSLATLVGHFPWFAVYNFLDARLPEPSPPKSQTNKTGNHQRLRVLLRRALIGFCSSFVSDCFSNGIRVVKTYRQTSLVPITYAEALSLLLEANGPAFVVRGLGLKIVSNGLSGILFAVLWKVIMERLEKRGKQPEPPVTNDDVDDDGKEEQELEKGYRKPKKA